MKSILTILFSFLFIVSGFSQTRNVVVDTNGVVVQPTNIWTANATNARSGLGLGSAATNPASAFQPSSAVLSNLTSSNGINLTNLRSTNIIGAVEIISGGTGATNAATARTNLELGATNSVIFSSITSENFVLSYGANLYIDSAWEDEGVSIFITRSGTGYALFNIGFTNNTLHMFAPIGFQDLSNAAVTRTNLGLGATNSVRFDSILLYQDGETTNAITYGADGLQFRQNGVEFFAMDSVSNGIVTFNKPISFLGTNEVANAATTRTNLGLGASWLTNTNAANFRTNIGLGATWLTNTNTSNFRSDIGLGWSALINTNAGTGLVSVNTNGEVVSPTNFWQVAPIQTIVQKFVPVTNSTNAGTNARNLYVYSLATNIFGVTNVVILPTNAATFVGDNVTVIHRGTTSSVTAIRQAGESTNLIVISNYDDAIAFIHENGTWDFYHNISFVEPIKFADGNLEFNKATSRTNLGLPLSALTNTSNASFQRAIIQTNSTPAAAANLNDAKAWLEISVVTNSVTNSFRIPVFQ